MRMRRPSFLPHVRPRQIAARVKRSERHRMRAPCVLCARALSLKSPRQQHPTHDT